MMPQPTVLEQLEAKLPELRQTFRPQDIILFGSQARGEAHEWSDIDLIIVSDAFEEVKWPYRHRPFFKIMWRDRSVDLICLTPEEFEKLLTWPGVVSTANREGIHLQ
jgi:uncharacterized protein